MRNDRKNNSPRKKGSKRREYEDKRDRNNETRSGPENDISWYSRYPNLLIAAGQFPFPNRPGMEIPFNSVTVNSKVYPRSFRIPGILSMDWIPSVGTSNLATDPASVAAKEIYSRVRAAFSGSLDADAPDYIVYLMSLDSIFSYIAWLKRLYRVLVAWTPENYVLPDGVLAAMGLTSEDVLELRSDRTHLWQAINELVLQSRKFTCPAFMDLFNRHYWMSDNVYTDEASLNSQFYMFNLRAVYQYAEVTLADGSTNKGAGLIMKPLPRGTTTSALTVDTLYTFGRALIDALVAWDDSYTISGYLKRAYEGNPMFYVDEIAANDALVPVYVPEVLAQIENSRTIPGGDNIYSWDGFKVSQNPLTNAVVSNPQYPCSNHIQIEMGQISRGGYLTAPTLSIRSDAPTVADNVVASRLLAVVTSYTTPSNLEGDYLCVVEAGTEIPLSWRMYKGLRNVGDSTGYFPIPSTPVYSDKDTITFTPDMLAMEQFDWHPFVWVTQVTSTTSAGQMIDVYPLGDTHNVTSISVNDLVNLHKICLFSEFNAFNA